MTTALCECELGSIAKIVAKFANKKWRKRLNTTAFAWPFFVADYQGVEMLFSSSAAICGAHFALAVSVTAARSENDTVGSSLDNVASKHPIIGIASIYNPLRPGSQEGGPKTASGERYDPSDWAAAIKASLRRKSGGVQYGARPKYALVEAAGKKVIVKINDVGPLTPGRIIDLNERTMVISIQACTAGVIANVRVEPLSGYLWTPGPIG